ncbi:MAG: response regulator [bacterium]|nr:response regulator [bacterium]
MAYQILVVDDSAVVRTVIKKVLALTDLTIGQIFEASNGAMALEVLDKNWIDLVFADLHMPIMSGIEMIDQMSKDGLLSSIPVIIVSSEGSETRIEEMRQKGVRAYVQKPFTPESIREAIQIVMKGRDEDEK